MVGLPLPTADPGNYCKDPVIVSPYTYLPKYLSPLVKTKVRNVPQPSKNGQKCSKKSKLHKNARKRPKIPKTFENADDLQKRLKTSEIFPAAAATAHSAVATAAAATAAAPRRPRRNRRGHALLHGRGCGRRQTFRVPKKSAIFFQKFCRGGGLAAGLSSRRPGPPPRRRRPQKFSKKNEKEQNG